MIGRTLGHYRIKAKLGQGGMGVVYQARDERLEREVALKVLPPGSLADESARRRFRKEALALSQLNHPNIATVHDFDRQDGVDFLVMELIPGVTLSDRLAAGALPEKDCLRLGSQLAEGLAAAHEAGVAHRDLKPGNLRVTPDGRLKILVFGLARSLRPESPEAPTQTLTETQGVAGTLPYMAPEQLRGARGDAQSDIYAAGAVLYEMATGRRAFPQSGPLLIDAVLNQPPLPAGGSPALETVVLKCLDKEPERRYQSARELRVDLQRLISPAPVAGPRGRFVRRLAVAAALLVLLLAAGIGGWRLLHRTGSIDVKSLAVLPLKSLGAQTADDYLGLGIADTIITKVSQVGGLTVRPTSAVRKFATPEANSMKAAGELRVDAVLEGAVQRSGDRLRINVNLLRVRDGVSLWSETFQAGFGDIFSIQDQVAQQVAAHLRFRLSAAEQAQLTKRHTSNPEAYEYYIKGRRSLAQRGGMGGRREEVDTAIAMFQRAAEVDPTYALAYAQLAYSYTIVALFHESDPVWIEHARQALGRASALDSNLAETHVVRHLMLYSAYEGFKIDEAAREVRLAQQIDPSVGHFELGSLYLHLGLEASLRELEQALAIDPTDTAIQSELAVCYASLCRYDEAIAWNRKFFGRLGPREALLGNRRLEDWQESVETALAKNPSDTHLRQQHALLLAIKGRSREAEAVIPPVPEGFRRNRSFHHFAHRMGELYAAVGKPGPAVEWLREAANAGLPSYTLFTCDPLLAPIRKDPAFVQFLNELEPRYRAWQREFQ